MQEDFSTKTGEGIYRRAALSLNKITLNGNDGVFFMQEKDAKKDEQTGKYPKIQVTKKGEPIEVVFLKIRRVLSAYAKKNSMKTSEHNHKKETVTLYKPDGKQVGVAEELRAQYPTLKTQQIVYCWLRESDSIVRVVIKGSSLGSEYKHKEQVLKFYDYLQSFGSDEHSHEFITKLVPVAEEGPQGEYYALSFVKGEKLDEEDLAKVKLMINDLHERISAIDERLHGTYKPKAQNKNELPTVDVNDIPIVEDDEKPEEEDDEEQEVGAPVGFKFNEEKEIDVKEIPF